MAPASRGGFFCYCKTGITGIILSRMTKGVSNLKNKKIERLLFLTADPKGPGPHQYKPLFPPLALMQLAALTPPKYQVTIVDESVGPIDFDFPADLVAITVTMSAVRPRANLIADRFRGREIPVVYGGVDPTFCPEECLEHADYVFRGEAEGGWEQFLGVLEKGEAPAIFTAEHFPSLVNIPSPKREGLNPQNYAYFNILQTARGCPNACDFCSVWLFSGQKLRFRPIGQTLDEIRLLPPGPLVFANDNIVADFDYAQELFRALIPLGRPWFAQADMTLLEKPELVALAAKSGCTVLFVGFESFNPASLKLANKGINEIARYHELVKLLHRHGVAIIPAMIFGFDTDTPAEFVRALRELNRLKADAPQFSVLTPLPGTRLYRRWQKEGKIQKTNLALYDGTHAVFQPAGMTATELENGVRELYHRYYRLRSIVWRLISDWWFWRHPLRRLNFFRLLFGHFVPRIWDWVKRLRKS